ncbi:unnamed protein product [Vicia faba]|uniref:PHD-type domain-containing protein n=1 Tax=Vicia faba TaxID=3906 RepID=A0AAV0ZP18_VICFA|nr:unnamed protein product [Vicia faba]
MLMNHYIHKLHSISPLKNQDHMNVHVCQSLEFKCKLERKYPDEISLHFGILQRAKKQIIKCKLTIHDAIRQLDSLSSVGSIEDGTCNRAFHQRCLDPPFDTENIPAGDQGWFCKSCECKTEILKATNAYLMTRFSLDNTWQDVFKEEDVIPDGDTGLLNQEDSSKAPYSRIKLESLKSETKFIDNRIVKCTGSCTIQAGTINVHDTRRENQKKLRKIWTSA